MREEVRVSVRDTNEYFGKENRDGEMNRNSTLHSSWCDASPHMMHTPLDIKICFFLLLLYIL